MSKKMFMIAVLALLIIGGFYIKRTVECFGSTGALNFPQISEISRGQSIALSFKMLRISAPGCFKDHSSDSYKNVSCGYRLKNSPNWNSGELIVKSDSETEYEVECKIPPLPFETPDSINLEYYIEYSSWGGPPERKTGLLLVR